MEIPLELKMVFLCSRNSFVSSFYPLHLFSEEQHYVKYEDDDNENYFCVNEDNYGKRYDRYDDTL